MSEARKRVAILISGRGSNMRALVEASRAPGYPAEVAVVISSEPDAAGLAWAKDQGIPALGLNHRHYESRAHFEGQLNQVLAASRVDIIALAGFMRLLTPDFVGKWLNRMINIHPSLLPAFKGLKTHERVLDAGVRITGCTVHLVRPEMDDGPIVAQAAVPVVEGDTPDTLASRVLAAEHRLYPRALALFASDQIKLEGERVMISGTINQDQILVSLPL